MKRPDAKLSILLMRRALLANRIEWIDCQRARLAQQIDRLITARLRRQLDRTTTTK